MYVLPKEGDSPEVLKAKQQVAECERRWSAANAELKAASEACANARAQLRVIVEGIPLGEVILTEDGKHKGIAEVCENSPYIRLRLLKSDGTPGMNYRLFSEGTPVRRPQD